MTGVHQKFQGETRLVSIRKPSSFSSPLSREGSCGSAALYYSCAKSLNFIKKKRSLTEISERTEKELNNNII